MNTFKENHDSALDDELRDLLIVTINADNSITLSDPDSGIIPINMSYGDVQVVGPDGSSIIIDGGIHPAIYTLTEPGKLEVYLVGREWVVTDNHVLDAFQNKRTNFPLGMTAD